MCVAVFQAMQCRTCGRKYHSRSGLESHQMRCSKVCVCVCVHACAYRYACLFKYSSFFLQYTSYIGSMHSDKAFHCAYPSELGTGSRGGMSY